LQVVQFIDQAGQVAAIEVFTIRAGTSSFLARVTDRFVPVFLQGAVNGAAFFAIEESAGRFVVIGVPITEAIREDLIDDRVLDPIRRLERRIIDG